MFPDHITFWNSGQLPESWTTEKLFESHPSSPYNSLIANAFFRSGDIESWGRGYKCILEAVSAYKLLPPKLEMLSGLMITYYTDIRSQLLAQRVDERYISVVEYAAKNGRVTNSDVQNILGGSKLTASRILQQMNGWIEMQGKVGKGIYYVPKWLIQRSHLKFILRQPLFLCIKKGGVQFDIPPIQNIYYQTLAKFQRKPYL